MRIAFVGILESRQAVVADVGFACGALHVVAAFDFLNSDSAFRAVLDAFLLFPFLKSFEAAIALVAILIAGQVFVHGVVATCADAGEAVAAYQYGTCLSWNLVDATTARVRTIAVCGEVRAHECGCRQS